MVQLTDEAKAAVKDEVRALLYDNQNVLNEAKKSIDEITLYQWIIRVSFLLFLGGSIIGVYKLQEYLDDRIAIRVAKFDNLYLVSVLAGSGQYRNALDEIAAFLEGLPADKSETGDLRIDKQLSGLTRLTRSQRDFFFVSLLESLHFIDELTPGGEYVGRDYWKALLKNWHFRREFIENPRWKADVKFNNRMANAYLRFGDPGVDAHLALIYFEAALNASPDVSWKVANNIGMAYASIPFAQAAAAKYIAIANRMRPNAVTMEGFVQGQDYQTCLRLWRKLQSGDFQDAIASIFSNAAGLETKKRYRRGWAI